MVLYNKLKPFSQEFLSSKVVVCDGSYGKCHRFDTYEELVVYMKNKMSAKEGLYICEYVYGPKEVNMYFDIDIKKEKCEAGADLMKIGAESSNNVNNWIELTFPGCLVTPHKAYAHRYSFKKVCTKYSEHLIIRVTDQTSRLLTISKLSCFKLFLHNYMTEDMR